MFEFLSCLACLWFAARLFRRPGQAVRCSPAWVAARESLRWGVLLVTVPLLGVLGVVRYARGEGVPSFYALALTTGLAALVLFGVRVGPTRRRLLDSVLLSVVLALASFTVVNGVPLALRLLTAAGLCTWLLACVAAGLVVRGLAWLGEKE
jgi:hypothetical protein